MIDILCLFPYVNINSYNVNQTLGLTLCLAHIVTDTVTFTAIILYMGIIAVEKMQTPTQIDGGRMLFPHMADKAMVSQLSGLLATTPRP